MEPSADQTTAESGSGAPEEAGAITAVYRCRNNGELFTLVTRTVAGGLGVFLPPGIGDSVYQVFEAAGPDRWEVGNTVFTVDEKGASLAIGERSHRCDHDRRASIWEHAKLNGVSFRAMGNEPGWVLEIREGERLDLSYDYGAARLSVPIAERRLDVEEKMTVYEGRTGEGSVRVTLRGERCLDTMSDEVFPTRVDVKLGEQSFSGCGRPLH